MTRLLVGHALGIYGFALAQGNGVVHSGLDAGIVALFAILASAGRNSRQVRSAAVAIGLLASSAVLVHLFRGAIEAHFHFFVMIAVLTLYEDWVPFLLAAAFVLVHHAVAGLLAPESVYGHAEQPLKWALIHAFFVAAAGAANVLSWRLHEQTRAHAGRLAVIVESSADAILSVGTDGRILSWNRGAARLFGWKASEIIGRHFSTLVPPGRAERDTAVAQRVLAGEYVEHFETVHRARDGCEIAVRLSASPLRDTDGSIVGASAILQDITGRKLAEQAVRRSEEALAYQAVHDALTGLPNRSLLEERLGHALLRGTRSGGRQALLFLDVDRFKLVNDSLGHAVGDELLIQLASRLEEALRPADTVARFGGDEFVILCEDVDSEEIAMTVAGRILEAVSRPVVLAGREHVMTASLGVALSSPGCTAESLLRDADIAMYRGKERGRARYELFDGEMRQRSLERMQIENELRQAVGDGQLRLHYQPMVSLDDGTITAVEALVRWEHPERGMLSPAAFIPIAEESPLILSVGAWVLEEACRQIAEWDDHLAPGFYVSVNVSARQVAAPDFVDTVRRALGSARTDPHRLAVEVTETALMEQDAAATSLMKLRELGVRIVLDDFGTGYSSLSYLSQLPLHGLKIDRSFVARMGSGTAEQAIVAAVGTMAAALKLNVVAEGVETEEQRAALMGMGYKLGQGHLFSRPVPPEALFPHADRPRWTRARRDDSRALDTGTWTSMHPAPVIRT